MGRGGLGCAATIERAGKQGSSEKQDLNDDLKDKKRKNSQDIHGEEQIEVTARQ